MVRKSRKVSDVEVVMSAELTKSLSKRARRTKRATPPPEPTITIAGYDGDEVRRAVKRLQYGGLTSKDRSLLCAVVYGVVWDAENTTLSRALKVS